MSDTSPSNPAQDNFGITIRGDSTNPSPLFSGRKGNRKVRTGCVTCKVRKVKCDEAKPSCLRCVKAGRKCGGYVLKPRVSRTTSPSSVPGLNTPSEIRAFDFFRQRSCALLGGITLKGEEFWGGLVVKLTVTEPAVRHAMLALSSLHESVCGSDNLAITEGNRHFTFREYNKAITAIRRFDMGSGKIAAAIPLLVCILFICIEFLMKCESAAQMHIMQGRMMLSRTTRYTVPSPTKDMVKKTLVPIYARLSLSSYLFGSKPEPIPRHLIFGEGIQPTVLGNVQQARDVLYYIMDEALALMTEAKLACYQPMEPWRLLMFKEGQQSFLTKLARWNAAFTVLRASLLSETTDSEATQNLLCLWYHATYIWISTALSPYESAYDQFASNFAAIISHASSAISRSLQKEDTGFTFETEIIAPLYWAATKCRHPLLRRAAVQLLNREEVTKRRENLWTSHELVVIASWVIEVEEQRTSADLYEHDLSPLFSHACYWDGDSGLRVPLSKPPMLSKPIIDFNEDQVNDFSQKINPLSQELKMPAILANVDSITLEAPHGVPEGARIKNVYIRAREKGGVWLTTFQDPRPGKSEWLVKKRFVRT